MAYSVVPNRFFTLPSIWNDDEDWTPVSVTSNGLSVSEDDKNVYIEAALPGVDPKDIDITFHDGYLWVKGESKVTKEKDRKYYREATSAFSYRVAVPGEIDQNVDPTATYKHGVMQVTFTKSPKAQPKKIQIKAGN